MTKGSTDKSLSAVMTKSLKDLINSSRAEMMILGRFRIAWKVSLKPEKER